MSMAIDDGFWVGVGATVAVVFVGLVTYKVLKKKRPKAIEKVRKSVTDAKAKTAKVAKGAKEAFREGYESAKKKAKAAAGPDAETAPATA